jgi:DNA-directed RNA polymerase specialized sigma24 family protein
MNRLRTFTLPWGRVAVMMTDSQIIREIKDGNVDLYATLMNRYQKKILSFIYHMLKSAKLELLAEDLSSETFYKAYRSLHSFREVDASFSTWLYTIARNTVLSELRKQKTAHVSLDDSTYIPIAINSLPEKQRSALILREYDGLDYQEIANILDQSVSSVKSLLFRARASVKTQLESYFNEPAMMKEYEEMKFR